MAALVVMLHHAMLRMDDGTGISAVQALLRRGYLGVDLFFVLSGFVMAMTYGSWFNGGHGFGLGRYLRFMLRRVARLWPLHAAVLALFVVAGLFDPVFPYSLRRLLANLAMVQAWGLSSAVNPPAWSVSAELFAYAMFPFLTVLALQGRKRPVLCLLGVAAALAVCAGSGPPIGPARRGVLDIYFNGSFLPVLRCLAGFTTGMLTWRALQLDLVRRAATWSWTGPAFVVAVPAALMTGAGDLAMFALMPGVVLSLHLGRGLAYRALGFGPLHRLGVLSYGIYLLHVFVLDHIDILAGNTGAEMLALGVIALLAASLAHLAVEVPGRRAIRRMGDAVLDRITRLSSRRPLHGRPR